MSTIPGYLTVEEAAKIIGVHRSQITRYCEEEDPNLRLPSIRLGNQRLFKPSDVKKFRRPSRGRPPAKKSA